MRGGWEEPTLAAVRTASSFQHIWDTAHLRFGDIRYPGKSCSPPLPAVDWAREFIIVAALGARPTLNGYAIYLSLSEDPHGLHVLVHEGLPDPHLVQLPAVGYPSVLLAVETAATDIAFHIQHPVVNYEPTTKQQDIRRKAFELWRRTQDDT